MFLDKEITIERKTGNPKQSWSLLSGTYRANIQPATAEATIFANGEFAKTFTAFVLAKVDVRDGDRITADGSRYTVRGIEDFSFGLIPHKRLTLMKE